MWRGFRSGVSKTTAESNVGLSVPNDEESSESEFNIVPVIDVVWLAGVSTPGWCIPLAIGDWLQ